MGISIQAAWSLLPGSRVKRAGVHAQYGGRTQSGISPSRTSPNVFLFANPEVAHENGYPYDGRVDRTDGSWIYQYTGEGLRGDQTLTGGNKSVLRHREEGRHLRLFESVGDASGDLRYIGEFELDGYEWAEAAEVDEGPLRQVVVFRLRPTDAITRNLIEGGPAPSDCELKPPSESVVHLVDVEEHLTDSAVVGARYEGYEAERRESQLVQTFKGYLNRRRIVAQRLRVLPAGEGAPIYSDLWLPAQQTLVEAKAATTRGSVRMALGQLADYSRFVPVAERAILLPHEPRSDLIALAHSQNATIVWPTGVDSYAASRAWAIP